MNPQAPVLHPLIASSIDPTKVSATVTGFLTGISGLAMLAATIYHFPLTPGAYNNFVQEMAGGISAIATAGGFLYMVFGILRKLIVKIFPKKNVQTPTA
jgi:hypothetical protein